jgi:hypothetical protein
MALTNPVKGSEAEFEEWYDQRHIGEVLSIPGFVTAQRYRLSPKQRAGVTPQWEFLALYEYDGDVETIHDNVVAHRNQMTLSGACAPDHTAWVYSPIGTKRVA